MDILDVVLAKALTPQGAVEQYAAQARQAATNANTAVNQANTAVEQANTALDTATSAAAAANSALEELDTNISNTVETEVNKLLLNMTTGHSADAALINLSLLYNSQPLSTLNSIIKYYNTTGQHTDGAMTQKAITDALTSLESKINTSSGGGGISNLGSENSGSMVTIDDEGNIIPSTITEAEIIQALLQSDTPVIQKIIGLEIDYTNKTFTRLQEAKDKTPGASFNEYLMYGGRTRCNVADDGTINAFYGDSDYSDTGSNGQVMVYQPKFYYLRIPVTTDTTINGEKVIRKEQILISDTQQTGFKLHPLFKAADGSELDYILLSAYEGSAYKTQDQTYDKADSSNINFTTDKLSSVSAAKPISGGNKNFTSDTAEQMSQNRGSGWHITNLAAESAAQMLEMVEFGTLNMQSSIELGLVNLPNDSRYNCAAITGSTASLGNSTGVAADGTVYEVNSRRTTYNVNGRRAITYRGVENPWGNIWHMIGGLNIVGINSETSGGIPYICTDFNYNQSAISNNYESIGFSLPATSDWISGFGYENSKYDWVFLPIECNNGNSVLPVGDNLWVQAQLNTINRASVGGVWSFGENCGPFYYAFDKTPTEANRATSARLMFIPEKNSIYNSNINKWRSHMGV